MTQRDNHPSPLASVRLRQPMHGVWCRAWSVRRGQKRQPLFCCWHLLKSISNEYIVSRRQCVSSHYVVCDSLQPQGLQHVRFPCPSLCPRPASANAGDPGSIPGLGRSPGEGNNHPVQYSWVFLVAQLVKKPPPMWETWVQSLGFLGNPMDRGACWATVHGVNWATSTFRDIGQHFFLFFCF